ncbi:MAG TPA: DUF5106 domain-containing protein [Flavobacteriales bacterium]|nr:DUF5106 domain-containing protein [Flavobacteriales bacterium]
MKKSLILLFFISCSVGLFAQKSGHEIRIKVNGIKDSACYLAGYYGKKQYYKDTAQFDSKGLCIFKGADTLPGGIYSIILPGNTYFEFLINEQHFSLETDTINLVQNMKIKGSLENQLFYDHFHLVASLQKEAEKHKKSLKRLREKDDQDSLKIVRRQLRAVNKQVEDYKLNIMKEYPKTLLAKIFKSMKDPEIPAPPKDENGKIIDSLFQYKYLKSHFWDNIDFTDDNILRTPIYHGRLMRYIQKMTAQIPDSINASADVLLEKAKANRQIFKYTLSKIIYMYETSKIMGMDAVFVHLAEKYYMTNQAFWIDSVQLFKISDRVRSIKPTLIGSPAPPIYYMKDRKGMQIPLYSIDAEFTILVFWDPDCGHCKKEMPKIDEVYQKYKTRSLKVYAVCTEVEQEKWIKYLDSHPYGWINVADFELHSPFRDLYDISSTPKIFLLDKDKKIVAKKIAHEALDEILGRKFRQIDRQKDK